VGLWTSPCPNNLTCVALGGQSLFYDCICPEGFELNGKRTNCVDIDECQKDDSKYCDTCVNTVGSFICGCKDGKELRYDGGQANCADINECLTENVCKVNEQCVNTHGSYTCVLACEFGMREENGKCVDIDECNEKIHQCAANQICKNKEIGYECLQSITSTVEKFQCFIDGTESVQTINSTCNKNLFPLSVECQKAFIKGCEYERNVKLCQFGIDYAMSGNSCFQADIQAENSAFFMCCAACFKGKLEFVVKRRCKTYGQKNASLYNIKSQCCSKMELQ
ncbi:hemicentin-1-like isoform X3, partial [Leptotrombidium deliense]